MNRQIIATSFNQDKHIYQDINRYFSYIEGKLAKDIIKVCYIGIASDDSFVKRMVFKGYIYLTYPKWEIYTLTANDLMDDMKTNIIYECDIIFVGDGDTTILMTCFNNTGLNDKLRKAYEKGVIMGGVGSGLLCWFKYSITNNPINKKEDIQSPEKSIFSPVECLNFLPFSATPNYQVKERKELYQTLVNDDELISGYGVPDGSIVHFVNETLIDSIDVRDKVEWIHRLLK